MHVSEASKAVFCFCWDGLWSHFCCFHCTINRFCLCMRFWKVSGYTEFSVKSWDIIRLYHVKDHGFSFERIICFPLIPTLTSPPPTLCNCDSRKTTKSADFAFFSILLVSRLRLTCSVCDGTLATSYWKCRERVLRVCKLVNIQILICNGQLGAKNHCCTVYHCHSVVIDVSQICLFPGFVWRAAYDTMSCTCDIGGV